MSDVGHIQCYDKSYSHLSPPTSSEEPTDCECPRDEGAQGRHQSGCKKWIKRRREAKKAGQFQHATGKRFEQWLNQYVAIDPRPVWHLTPYAGEVEEIPTEKWCAIGDITGHACAGASLAGASWDLGVRAITILRT